MKLSRKNKTNLRKITGTPHVPPDLTMEPPVWRPRGRPRKRRRKEDETVTVAPKSIPEAKKTITPVALVGRYVLKEFPRSVVLLGKVVCYESGLYRVAYEDGGCEDLDSREIRRLLLDDSYFDDELNRRKCELDESLLPKIADASEKSSGELRGDLASEKSSSEFCGDLTVENEEGLDETDVDSSSDSRALCSDAETPLPLPPSSGTIGVPEPYVSYLFSVYGFLRSFSTRLFLSPFALDEFVGALNCRVSNTLLDAVNVCLMRVLRRHLERLSAEGSRIASKCLR